MKAGSCLGLLGPLGEADAVVGDLLFEFVDSRDVRVDDRLVDQRPQSFSTWRLVTSARGSTPCFCVTI